MVGREFQSIRRIRKRGKKRQRREDRKRKILKFERRGKKRN